MTSADVARLVLGYLSDKGLQQTKSVFFSECLDLRNDDLSGSSDLTNGQKLSLIIEEYFVLKGHDKRLKRDPQSILLLLWKQFDVLVGQLKHSTIHAKEKAKAGTGVPQKIRVRELNRQNRASLQRGKLNTFIPNHDLLKVQHIKCETVKSHQGFTPPPQRLGNAIGVQAKLDSRLPFNNVCSTAETFQPPSIPNDNFQLVPVIQCEVVQRNTLAENVKVVTSSNSSSMGGSEIPLSHSMGSKTPFPKDQLLLADQFKSPKRKSVQPKRHPVVAEAVSKSPLAQHSVIIPVVETSPDEQQLDLSSLVEKILGQPEFSEKLAENINRAVEMDTPIDHKESKEKDNSTGMQGAVVDSVKVENIMEMMKTDPAFEELFSSFESFTNSCEESDLEPRNQSEEHGDETNQIKSTSEKGNCASVATDALLLLARSPSKQDELNCSESLNTPNKNNHMSVSKKLPQGLDKTGAVFRSPCSATLRSVPVIMSPGKTKSPTNRAAQPIFSHIRQLDFSSVGNVPSVSNSGVKSSGNATSICSETTVVAPDFTHCLTSATNVTKNSGQEQETAAGKKDSDRKSSAEDGISVAGGQKILDASSSLQENAQVNFRENVVGYKNISQCSQLVSSENDSREEDDELGKDNDKKTLSLDTEENSLSVLEELATHVFTQREESAHEAESKDCLLMSNKDRKGNGEESEEHCVSPRNEFAFHESTGTEKEHHGEGKMLLTEGLTSLTESCASFTDGFTSIKQSIPGGSSHKKVVSKTGSLNPSDPSDPTVPEDSEGCLGKKSVNEESERLLQKVNQRTPLTNVTGSAQVPKRKLKKNKKSNGTTKKRKTLPADLDVDKFLSRLHYVEKTHNKTTD